MITLQCADCNLLTGGSAGAESIAEQSATRMTMIATIYESVNMTVIMTVTIPLNIFPVAFNLSHTSPPLSAICLLCNPFVLRCNTIPWYSSLDSPLL